MSDALQHAIAYQFNDASLLQLALTHPSLATQTNNQRLEFLGDTVLGLVIGNMLYKQFPEEKEGDLAKRFAALVRGSTLVKEAKKIDLGNYLILGASEQQSAGSENESNLEDAMEALIGALYLDGGLPAAEAFIIPRWMPLLNHMEEPPKDAKTELQEWAQSKGYSLPKYEQVEKTGPAHAPEFTMQVSVKGHEPVQAINTSKRAAEHAAAKILLKKIGKQS